MSGRAIAADVPLQVFPLDSPDGRALVPLGGCDLRLDALSVGFDCRLYDWTVSIPSGCVVVQYAAGAQSANSGEVMVAGGTAAAVAGVLARAGYSVRVEGGNDGEV